MTGFLGGYAIASTMILGLFCIGAKELIKDQNDYKKKIDVLQKENLKLHKLLGYAAGLDKAKKEEE